MLGLFLAVPFLIFSQTGKPSAQPEVLIIGTFHFNNPGADAVKFKTKNIQTPTAQKELEIIADKIRLFSPDKIFVEWDYNDQQRLDSLYELYLAGEYDNYVERTYKNTDQYNFYTQNEIIQLAFRAGKKAGVKKMCAIDYSLDLPADTVFAAIQAAGQEQLMKEIETAMKELGEEFDRKMEKLSLTELILDLNTNEERKRNVGLYIKMFNRGGKTDNFSGANCVAEWYRRNLFMYSLVQKMTERSDDKIMILLGSGHTAMIQNFVEAENHFKIVPLHQVLR